MCGIAYLFTLRHLSSSTLCSNNLLFNCSHDCFSNRKLSFDLHLNSVTGGCDSPSYLDQGVRLEVRRPGNTWEPIRFYTPTNETTEISLVTLLPGGSHVEDENNSVFPVNIYNGSETYSVSEYLCGEVYYRPGTQYRWLQRYSGPSLNGMETWSLGNVSIMYAEQGVHCSVQLTERAFTNPDGLLLDWTAPGCEQGPIQHGTVYFFNVSEVNGHAQRSVVVTPLWWNAECSPRLTAG